MAAIKQNLLKINTCTDWALTDHKKMNGSSRGVIIGLGEMCIELFFSIHVKILNWWKA